ncbi:MAG: hypothetical protein D6796_06420 [Caldilineae bacterium]|nr:MAG: hypothetical protein D6796_06420 [Caldilineae bacterium]
MTRLTPILLLTLFLLLIALLIRWGFRHAARPPGDSLWPESSSELYLLLAVAIAALILLATYLVLLP